MAKLQIISDIHLEYRSNIFKFPKCGEYLALLGDIGHPNTELYKDFIKAQSERFTKVYVIAGNHEFYGHSIRQSKALIKKACKEAGKNVIFLDNKFDYIDDNVIVIGSTLWSKLDLTDDWSFFSDVLNIKDWSVKKSNTTHSKCIKFIHKTLLLHQSKMLQ